MQEENRSYFRITLSPARIRRAATLNLNGCWWIFFIGMFIYYIFSEVIINITSLYFPTGYIAVSTAQIPAFLKEYMVSNPRIPVLPGLYALLMGGALELGRTIYTLAALRDRMVIPNLMFEGFGVYFKALAISIARDFIITVGFMCFFVPGIVMYYSYRQSYFALAENGKAGVFQCLRESRRMMSGNKMALFRLDMTYIFTIIVAYIPSYMLLAYGLVDTSTLSGMILYYLAQIPFFMVMGNYFMGQTVFYELIQCGNFKNFRFKGEDFFREIGKE